VSGAEVRGARTSGPHLTVGDVREGQRLAPLVHDVTATTIVLGALASRDWRPMHHDHSFAVHRNGTRDIFMNTPTQAAWFERYLTDWTGPKGRLGRMRFRMLGSVFPGDTMVFAGTVGTVDVDVKLRIVAGLMDVQIDRAGHAVQILNQGIRECAVGRHIESDDLHIDGRG